MPALPAALAADAKRVRRNMLRRAVRRLVCLTVADRVEVARSRSRSPPPPSVTLAIKEETSSETATASSDDDDDSDDFNEDEDGDVSSLSVREIPDRETAAAASAPSIGMRWVVTFSNGARAARRGRAHYEECATLLDDGRLATTRTVLGYAAAGPENAAAAVLFD